MIRPQFALEHSRQHFPGAVKDRREVHGDHVIPSIRGKLDDRRDMLNAGVVHQDVHAAEDSVRERRPDAGSGRGRVRSASQ